MAPKEFLALSGAAGPRPAKFRQMTNQPTRNPEGSSGLSSFRLQVLALARVSPESPAGIIRSIFFQV
jgi:hypothetical protein